MISESFGTGSKSYCDIDLLTKINARNAGIYKQRALIRGKKSDRPILCFFGLLIFTASGDSAECWRFTATIPARKGNRKAESINPEKSFYLHSGCLIC